MKSILLPPGRSGLALRYGPERQRPRRQAERTARLSAVVFARWLARRGHTREEAAVRLGVSSRALEAWIRLWRTKRLALRPRGRPSEMLTRVVRREVLGLLYLLGPQTGLAVLQARFPGVPRAALADLLHRYRIAHKRGHRCLIHALRWKKAGRVWAMDFEKPPGPIDGRYSRLLLVRDLASGEQLLARPTLGESAWVVMVALRALFREHGAPLVIKADNGGGFRAWETKALLRRHGALPLYSPAETPQYNGSCEAGIGSIETRAHYIAAQHDRPGAWTADDVEQARRQANEMARPQGADGPTPDELWHRRELIRESERRAFTVNYWKFFERERRERSMLPHVLNHWQQSSIDRIAIPRTLIECGVLEIRRRRISLPFSRKTCARIS